MFLICILYTCKLLVLMIRCTQTILNFYCIHSLDSRIHYQTDKRQFFLSDICVFLSGRRIMDKPTKITNGEFRLICLSYRAQEPCTDYVKFLFSHSTLPRKP